MLEKLRDELTDNDIFFRNIKINNQALTLIYIETLVSGEKINKLVLDNNIYINRKNLIKINNYQDIINNLFNGFIIFYISDTEIYCIEERANLDRGINTTDSEISIRGPKDSFTENHNKNLGLIRNKIS